MFASEDRGLRIKNLRSQNRTGAGTLISFNRKLRVKIEGSWPEWCILSMIYSRDTPFWSETLEM